MYTNHSHPIQLGLCIMYPSPGVIERIGKDWDWIWLDGQHGQIAGYETMLAMVRACHSVGVPAFVRVPGHEASWIGLALDAGASAVIVPQVESAEQADFLVKAAKFPPTGNRSFGGRRPIDLHGRGYYAESNDSTKLICQIESPDALKNAGEIAGIDGVDGLFLGSDDYLLRSGIEIAQSGGDPQLAEAMSALSRICGPLGKSLVGVGAGAGSFALCIENGATHVVVGGDVGFLAGGSKSAAQNARLALEARETKSAAPDSSSSPLY